MRHVSLFVVLVSSFFVTGCIHDEKLNLEADFEFEAIDNESNKVNLVVTIRYSLKNSLEKKLVRKYGGRAVGPYQFFPHYKDSLFLPAISSVSGIVLKEYSAIEIYNYKREEIEQKLEEQTKLRLAQYGIAITDFIIRSIELSDTLRSRLEKEHVARFENAMNNCRRETRGVVTKTHDLSNGKLVFYEFSVENRKYKSFLGREETVGNESIGDSLTIEYACEDAIFNRVKR